MSGIGALDRSARVEATTARIADRLDLAAEVAPWRAYRWAGEEPGRPVLHLDDFSELPFLDGIAGVEHYQHRARLRAGDGDLFAAVVPQVEGYEAYCRERLGLGSPGFVAARERAGPLAIAAACAAGAAFDTLVGTARSARGLDLHPFMGIEAVWTLARRLERQAGAPVRVIGPPPPVTWVANDKALLSDLVEGILGPEWLAETDVAGGVDEVVSKLRRLARRHRQVAIKRLRCVSGMGNRVFDAAEITGGGSLRPAVEEFLARTEWDGVEPVQVVAWEQVTVSPSTQLWIPPAGAGEPRLDGVYEQILEGDRGVFAGSRPSTLPEAVDRSLGEGALAVAAALQRLGYVGRCSFDHLVSGDLGGEFQVLFVECNGRWGGTSLPMRLVERAVPGPRPVYRAQDFVRPGLVGARLTDLLAALGEELYDRRTGGGRFLFYNVGPLERHGMVDVIALGATQAEADAALLEDLPRRLGV